MGDVEMIRQTARNLLTEEATKGSDGFRQWFYPEAPKGYLVNTELDSLIDTGIKAGKSAQQIADTIKDSVEVWIHSVDCRGAMDASKPDHQERWARLIESMNKPNNITEIDEQTWYYWLEVLPPIVMHQRVRKGGRVYSFGFAEGAEDIKGFWHQGGRYFVEDTGVANPYA
jgi:hypothetical protein